METVQNGEFFYPERLEHHGILGQKHGERKYQNKDGTLTPEGRLRYLKNPNEYRNSKNETATERKGFIARLKMRKKNAEVKKAKDISSGKETVKAKLKVPGKKVTDVYFTPAEAVKAKDPGHLKTFEDPTTMSDTELKAAIERMRLEKDFQQKYSELHPVQLSAGQKFMKKLGEQALEKLPVAAMDIATTQIKKKVNEMFEDTDPNAKLKKELETWKLRGEIAKNETTVLGVDRAKFELEKAKETWQNAKDAKDKALRTEAESKAKEAKEAAEKEQADAQAKAEQARVERDTRKAQKAAEREAEKEAKRVEKDEKDAAKEWKKEAEERERLEKEFLQKEKAATKQALADAKRQLEYEKYKASPKYQDDFDRMIDRVDSKLAVPGTTYASGSSYLQSLQRSGVLSQTTVDSLEEATSDLKQETQRLMQELDRQQRK